MIDRRLHAVATGLLGLGVAYLGLTRYVGADRVQAPAETGRLREKPRAEGGVLAGSGTGVVARQPALPDVSTATLRQALSAMASGELAPPDPTPDGPLAQARATLNERLLSGSANPERVARLERSIRPLLVASILGEAVAELRCSATMCRVNLIGEDDARVDSAANAFAEHLPKTFSSAVTYPDGSGHRSVYLGTSADDLKLSSEPSRPLEVVTREATAPPGSSSLHDDP